MGGQIGEREVRGGKGSLISRVVQGEHGAEGKPLLAHQGGNQCGLPVVEVQYRGAGLEALGQFDDGPREKDEPHRVVGVGGGGVPVNAGPAKEGVVVDEQQLGAVGLDFFVDGDGLQRVTHREGELDVDGGGVRHQGRITGQDHHHIVPHRLQKTGKRGEHLAQASSRGVGRHLTGREKDRHRGHLHHRDSAGAIGFCFAPQITRSAEIHCCSLQTNPKSAPALS